ncbi:alpha/beta hydrolase [Chloroflexus sp.]|uniref:alpha/beta hydrolase n=1 Tax=Chloroflexus sp. TaxID=1904827 RepID=UPI002625CD34|nr:alpha/beta fold hydrolase [uncultured Chloroflexus sp.]
MNTLVVTILKILAVVGFGYALLCLFIYAVQERLIFVPHIDPPGAAYDTRSAAEDIWLPVENATLHALWFRYPDPRGIILYFHGNGGTLRSWVAVAPDLVERGYDLLLVDYRGYGRSTGQISGEDQLHADMTAVYDWAVARYPETQIVLYGRSLGSSFATRLAATRNPGLLILESPFYSLEALARRQFPWAPSFLLKYPLRTHEWIGQVRCPIVIIHGTDDTVVPFTHSEQLANLVTAPLRFHRIEGGGHNNLATFAAYHAAIDAALTQ